MFRVAETVAGREVALAATFLCGFSAFLLRYNGEVKAYALDALFGAAIPYIILRLGQAEKPLARLLVYGWIAAMTLGSVAAPVLVGGLFLAIVTTAEARRRVGWTTLIGATTIAAVAYLALHFVVYRANMNAPPMTGFWSESYLALGHAGAVARSRFALQSLASLLPSFAPLAREFRLILVVAGGALLLPRRAGLGIALAAPTVLALACSAVGLYPIAPRLLLFALPPLLLCLAQILVAMVPRTRQDSRRALVVVVILGIASISSLRMLPNIAPMSRLLIVALLGLLVASRMPWGLRALLPVCLALAVTAQQAVAVVRDPTLEDGRATIARVLRARPSAIYIPAASAATWLYYSSPWDRIDRPRVNWYAVQARISGTAVPFSDNPSAQPGRAEIWRQDDRVEILGTLPGVVYRPPRGFISAPRPGWAVSEASRINQAVGQQLIIVETHSLPGAPEALLAALKATGWREDSTRREKTAAATFLRRSGGI
jgi:hypothetical protein